MQVHRTLGIFFSKDRREEVIEVEEDPEFATLPGFRAPVKLMTQAQWMKGCPEGTEQSFLFALYDQLCNNYCPCPQGCAYKVPRKKSDFFPLFVSQSVFRTLNLLIIRRRTFHRISTIFVKLPYSHVPSVASDFALLAVNFYPCPTAIRPCSTVQTYKVSYSASGWPYWKLFSMNKGNTLHPIASKDQNQARGGK